jgi:hypothetical protein
MKVELLCLDSTNKPSPISEGVVEIRINSQPQGYKSNNTTHADPKGTTSGNSSWYDQGDDHDPPHPNACLSHVCLSGYTVGDPCTILLYTH